MLSGLVMGIVVLIAAYCAYCVYCDVIVLCDALDLGGGSQSYPNRGDCLMGGGRVISIFTYLFLGGQHILIVQETVPLSSA